MEASKSAMERAFTVIAPLSRTCGCIAPIFDGACASIRLLHLISAWVKEGRKEGVLDIPHRYTTHSISHWISRFLRFCSKHWLGRSNNLDTFGRVLCLSHPANSTAAEQVLRTDGG